MPTLFLDWFTESTGSLARHCALWHVDWTEVVTRLLSINNPMSTQTVHRARTDSHRARTPQQSSSHRCIFLILLNLYIQKCKNSVENLKFRVILWKILQNFLIFLLISTPHITVLWKLLKYLYAPFKDKLKFLVRNIHQCARLQQSPSCSTFLQDQPGPAATTWEHTESRVLCEVCSS